DEHRSDSSRIPQRGRLDYIWAGVGKPEPAGICRTTDAERLQGWSNKLGLRILAERVSRNHSPIWSGSHSKPRPATGRDSRARAADAGSRRELESYARRTTRG